MREFYRNPAFAPFAVSFLFVATLAAYYWTLLPVGTIQQGDEYITLDRVHSFLIRNDYWTVYSNNLPTFKKPPLQYWITAYLLRGGADLEFALRFPSFLFGILTLINVGILAYVLFPANPWVAPAATALLAGSATFWASNISALLDSGAMLFSTMAITGCLLAFYRPRWWYFVALAIGLGALQKAPIPLLLVAVMVAFAFASKTYHQIDLRASLLNRHFWIATALMLVAVLFWPVLQWIIYGPQSFHEAYMNQMVERFSPFGEGGGRRRSWLTVLLSGEVLLRVPAIIALLALPWLLRRMELVSLPLMLVGFAIVTLFASGYISPRYSLIFMPLLMATLAVVLIKTIPLKVFVVAIILALAVSKGGPVKSAKALGLFNTAQQKYVPLLQSIAKSLSENETLVVCRSADLPRIARSAISYFASNGRPFQEVGSPRDFERLRQRGSIAPPYRGLCKARDLEKLQPLLGNYKTIEESDDYVHWTAR
jgi:4-amino-4-deoxy-L-arabinose transferase-like glycosyltransferase